MKLIESEDVILFTYSVYGGTLAKDLSFTDLSKFCGTIVIDVPLSVYTESRPDTVFFEQQPRLYHNLGNCRHYKVSGTMYRPTSGGRITPSELRSVFGQTYDQHGVGYDILSRSIDGSEYYTTQYGTYNKCGWGSWAFGLGVKREGRIVFAAAGYPDLIGNQHFRNGYRLAAYEFRDRNGQAQVRYASFSGALNLYRTHEISPYEIIEQYKEQLIALLNDSTWQRWDAVHSAAPVSFSEIKIPSWDQVFPPTDRTVQWGELASEAYSSVPFFSSNGIAYGLDLLSFKRDVNQTLELLQSLGSKGKLAKKAASLFLSFYYGWRLLYNDTRELFDAYEKAANSRNFLNRATSRRTWGAHGATYVAVLQCYYHRYSKVSQLDQFILKNDLALTPDNLWDLIPFSFVVDWFTNIGGFLEDASNYYEFTQSHEVVCTGRSIKATKRVPAFKLAPGLAGELTFSYYNREYVPYAIDPTFHFSNSVDPLDHFIEGTALIVSRR